MLLDPIGIDIGAGRALDFFQMRETMECRDKVSLPSHPARLDRPAQRETFDLDPQLHEVDQMLSRYRRDTKTLVLLQRYQAFGFEPHQGFANGASANTVAIA